METIEEIKAYIDEFGDQDEPVLIFTNYETAFVGLTHTNRAVYDFNKMVEYLVLTDNITELEAIEWIEYNTIPSLSYADNKPIILYPLVEV